MDCVISCDYKWVTNIIQINKLHTNYIISNQFKSLLGVTSYTI